MVEQKAFPRDKTCGDGLTPRAIGVLREMGLGDSTVGWQRVRGVRVRSAARHQNRAHADHETLVRPRVGHTASGLVAMIADPEPMERLVRRMMATDRRFRFALTLLLNLDDPSMRTLDQLVARRLVWLADALGWEPRPPTSTQLSAAVPRP